MKIGFKNFRKFADFPSLELAPITMLVGGNNAGKSTVVKALLAVRDFIEYSSRGYDFEVLDDDSFLGDDLNPVNRKKKENAPVKFYFNSSYQAHLGTFKRALYNKSDDNIIEFNFSDADFDMIIRISGNPTDKDAISGDVVFLSVLHKRYNIEYKFDFLKRTFNTIYKRKKLLGRNRTTGEETVMYELDHEIEVKGALILSQYYGLHSLFRYYENFLIANGLMRNRFVSNDDEMEVAKFDKCKIEGLCEDDFYTLQNLLNIRSLQNRIMFVRSSNMEYIYAHSVTQSVIYSAKDTNDYLVKTVHEFANLRLRSNSSIVNFINEWMEKFNIGKSFKIESVGGEAHIVKIVNFDDEEVNLADKGMGSIQLMILLFRIATIMRNSRNSLVIVEEPEQNLHPSLQSKLADFFFDCNRNKKLRIDFLIETHSEYLVRKTQLIVANKLNEATTAEQKTLLLKNNPFKVYYFPNEGEPYDMCYGENGKFERSFDRGFFDEAASMHLELLRLQSGKGK